eukprot:GHVS01064139.1.p1 GENE.GHVS01064139.1~~GHVS01064139.1.p1  ORF type:complete len:286 (+),score=14.36 GHVS01064139.1:25-882(+)
MHQRNGNTLFQNESYQLLLCCWLTSDSTKVSQDRNNGNWQASQSVEKESEQKTCKPVVTTQAPDERKGQSEQCGERECAVLERASTTLLDDMLEEILDCTEHNTPSTKTFNTLQKGCPAHGSHIGGPINANRNSSSHFNHVQRSITAKAGATSSVRKKWDDGDLIVGSGTCRHTDQKCEAFYVGGSQWDRGRNTFPQDSQSCDVLCCDNLRCTSCDFGVIQLPDCSWESSIDYLHLRNYYPNNQMLRKRASKVPGSAAYCCQCTWLTAAGQPTPCIKDSWRCFGH